MTPQEKQRLETLEKLVNSLLSVTNVPFIESLNRRLSTGIIDEDLFAATTISQAVDEGGVATYSVAKVPDGKLSITLTDGTVKYIGVYNS